MKAEGRDSKSGNTNAETKGATDTKSQTTTGNAAHFGDRSSAGREAHPDRYRDQVGEAFEETTNVNFKISVGTRGSGDRSASTRSRRGSSRSIRNGAAMRSSWSAADTSSSVRRRTRSSTSSKAKPL